MATTSASLGATRQLNRTNWIRIVVAGVVVLAAGVFTIYTVETQMKEMLRDDLQTILDADVAALTIWLDDHRNKARALAGSYGISQSVPGMVAEAQGDVDDSQLRRSPHLDALQRWFDRVVETLEYEGFVVMLPSGRIIGASAAKEDGIGSKALFQASSVFSRVFDPTIPVQDRATVSLPFRSPFRRIGGVGGLGEPVMYAVAPILDESNQVVALLGLRIDPEDKFTDILSVARSGRTGETYAFNRDGVMLSNTRFPKDLLQIGLLDQDLESGAILEIQVRDPGGDMTDGFRPKVPRHQLPKTVMAESATNGETGVDVDGYNDYRGVPVIGAWTWIDRYEFGVATEVDTWEAFSVLRTLRGVFGGLFALLVVMVVGALIYARWLDKARRRAMKAERAASTLGSYTLLKKIGEGGMGEVWLARHSMLRRPTAVKLLPPEKSSKEAVGRFEREVQMTAQLSHPNTISIYDYGHTPDGIFYYAMEYLHGLQLDDVVNATGPMTSERVCSVLKQACGSLHEAHVAGMIHRDVKPANMMLCEHGGLVDFVKVLDFGLVKNLIEKDAANLSQSGIITGTPMYISPEVVIGEDEITAAADVYALGAVAYYLLTGRPVFDCTNAIDHLVAHTKEIPVPPSQKTDIPVDPGLEDLILKCLEKDPADRPASALELSEALDALDLGREWDQPEARAWWSAHAEQLETALSIAREDLPTGISGVSFHIALEDRDD